MSGGGGTVFSVLGGPASVSFWLADTRRRHMRAMFGLVALLVTTAVILYSFTKTEIPVLKKGEETRQQAAASGATLTAPPLPRRSR